MVRYLIKKGIAQLSIEERAMKEFGVYLLSLGMFIISTGLAFGDEPVKIGFVDMQKVLKISEVGKGARKQMDLETEKIRKEIAGKERELERLKEDLERRGTVMSEAMRLDKERDTNSSCVICNALAKMLIKSSNLRIGTWSCRS